MLHGTITNRKRSRTYLVVLHIFFGLLLAASLALVFGGVVMLLWNGLLPNIFGISRITYWQGVGLLLLARILVGGFGHSKSGHGQGVRQREQEPCEAYDAWWREVGEKSFFRYSKQDQGEVEPRD